VTVPEVELYSGAEWAAIEGWTPAPCLPRRTEGVAGLRRTTAGGAVAAAVLLGLRDALDGPPSDEAAVVVEVSGEPDDPAVPVVLRFDVTSPAATVAVVRRPGAEPGEAPGGRLPR
jgi:hypothetical protein